MNHIQCRFPSFNWSAGGQRAWMALGALVIRSSGLRIQILATAVNRMGHLVIEGKISLAVCPRWSWDQEEDINRHKVNKS